MKYFINNAFLKIYLSLSLSLCFLISTFAQSEQFITALNVSEANLTTDESSRWQHFSNMANTLSISLVQIDTLSSGALAGEIFTFSIPGVETEIIAQGRFIQQTSKEDYVWWANIDNDRGYFGIASNTAGKVAYAQVDGQHYMMYLLSDRYNALVEVNTETDTLPQLCLPGLEIPSDITFSDDCEVDNDCSAVISVLVLVTPEAMDWLGGNYTPLQSLVYFSLGLNTVNFALINSGVYHKSVRFIVESYDFTFSQNPNPQVLDDLILLRDDNAANNRRTATRADLMFLITDSRYFPLLGAVLNSSTSGPQLGIVSMEFLISKYFTFAHEIGHCFLLNHNRESNLGDINYEGDEFCAFGWRFQTSANSVKKTIMAVLRAEDLQSSTKILNYSNPNISFGGTPTGTAINFNARHASHNMCSVDDIFYDDELRVDITGPLFACEENVTYTANITSPGAGVPGVGPYNIRWAVSATEFPTISTPLGSSNPLTLYSGNLPSPVFWLFVSVISADGVFMNDIIMVDNPCGTPTPLIGGTSGIASIESNTQAFELSPNPANQTLRVKLLRQPTNTAAKYSIFNSIGESVLSGATETAIQETIELDLNLNRIPAGLYYFFLSADNFSEVQKFVIHH